MAIAWLATAPLLSASDKDQPVDSDGYKAVSVGGKGGPVVRVKEEPGPYKNVKSSHTPDKYEPDQPDYSHTSSFANKRFSSSEALISKNNSSIDAREQRTFITKPYFGNTSTQTDKTTPNLNAPVSPSGASAYGHDASGFNKSFATSSADASMTKTAALASTTSEYQGRTARLGDQKTEVFASTTLASKQYLGPGAQKVPDGITIKDNVVMTRMSGLPDRDLTVDEVRDLINHETKPDTNAKPEPPSKSLNDPDYKPVPSPAPPAMEDDKNDPVPPPGTMAVPQPPENSEPLPR